MAGTRRAPWVLFLVMAVFGFLMALQFRLQQRVQALSGRLQRPEELAARVRAAEEKVMALEQENAELRRLIAGQQSRAELDARAVILAGAVPLEGPGVVVRVEPGPSGPGQQTRPILIQDDDLRRVINELVAGGAEAVAVNGQRLVAVSEVRSVGMHVVVNGVPLAPPFEIVAIGDPNVLVASLQLRGGVVDVLRVLGLQVSVQPADKVQVPAYRARTQFRFARPVKP